MTIFFFRELKKFIKPCNISCNIKLPLKWDEFTSNVGRSLLSNTKRKIKKLEKIGKLSLQIIDIKDIDQNNHKIIFCKLFEDKGKRLIKTGNKNIFLHKGLQNFYMKMPHKLSSSSKTQLSILTLDDKIIASHWGVVDKRTFYWILPAFSEDWLWYSPGRIIMFFLIEWSINNNLKKFDFTIGNEKYKDDWANCKTSLFEIIYIKNFYGFIYLLKIYLKKYIKRIFLLITF